MVELLVTLALLTVGSGASDPAPPELWAGHQVVFGSKKLPLLGTVETRTDTFVLAEVKRTAGGLELVERPCEVRFGEVAGARAEVSKAAVRSIPPARVQYREVQDGRWIAKAWRSGWDEADHDRDGQPGLTVRIDAPLCGGELHVATDARSIARALGSAGGALTGELRVSVKQRVLGAEGACLGAVASDGEEKLRGWFTYVPVDAGATCESLQAAWPAVVKNAGKS